MIKEVKTSDLGMNVVAVWDRLLWDLTELEIVRANAIEKLFQEALQEEVGENWRAYDRDHGDRHIYLDMEQVSGHDWVGSTTRRKDGGERHEFRPPSISGWLICDSLDENTLMRVSEGAELQRFERVCRWCRMTTHTQLPTCTSCDRI